MDDYAHLVTRFNPITGEIPGFPNSVRRLSDLRGAFVDTVAYDQALAQEDRVIYITAGVNFPANPGELNYAIGLITPGKIGSEYHMTKGHFHAWRPAAEVYIGLRGEGFLLLESEDRQETKLLHLQPNTAVYVPGYTAHRTINTGREPLTYLGIYPAEAGHDYGSIVQDNFKKILVEVDERPTLVDRSEFILTKSN